MICGPQQETLFGSAEHGKGQEILLLAHWFVLVDGLSLVY